ncbi:glycosyltransferase [Klebsiella pneumoniae]|uniref:glycosyltransferase n=1 Tax=Klebsiella pneumoniae TaxID=573 RepID=UPI0023816744|nr:glycosyltransferase [Klebsiella pneumoniae]MDE4776823.1 glycosyltransferase [Klebsiella pneumoniae]
MKNNILFITSRTDMGGGPKHLLQLIENINQEKYNVYLACPKDEPFFSKYREIVPDENFYFLKHRTFNLGYFKGLLNFCKKNNISIIHSHGRGAGVFSRLLKVFMRKVKVIHTFHGLNLSQDKDLKTLLKNIVYVISERAFSYLTDEFIYVSNGECSIAKKRGISSRTDKDNIIINGVRIPSEGQTKLVSDSFKIVVISRFDYQKNTDLLVDVIECLERANVNPSINIIIDVLGEGDDIYKLHNITGLKRVKIIQHGNVNNPYVFFDNAHFVLNTSRWEGLPLSVIEAMARGCIPILTDVVGNTDIIGHTKLKTNLFTSALQVASLMSQYEEEVSKIDLDAKEARDIIIHNFNEVIMCHKTFLLYE